MMSGDGQRLDQQQPEKYAHPYTTRSQSAIDIVASLVIWVLPAALVAGYLLGFTIDLRAPPAHWPDYGYPIFGATLLGMVVAHEGLHALAARLFGLRVSFGIKWYGAAVYTRYSGGRVTRWQRMMITLAPMVVIAVACIISYRFTTSNGVMALALIVMFANTISSAGDLQSAVALLRVPYGTVFEIPDRDSDMAIYEPKDYAIMESSKLTTRASTLPAGELPRDPRGSLTREFDHWMSDLWIAASNRRLQSTARVYGQSLWRRLSRWILTQTPPSIQTHH